ncbi:extracellular solute-binding protein [Frankia sp. AiPa1]|uniref:extracellular solute-binding protein n=1 Tax=Frankia sp. AiPa1 TaxID=573492 RepID=UPI00202B64D1|nr:extracellular solute-binding protein [Frankia sp. AiPa1]MCL9762602.1 extracellular solute-binding protein [Frankia sp. AiPa1]
MSARGRSETGRWPTPSRRQLVRAAAATITVGVGVPGGLALSGLLRARDDGDDPDLRRVRWAASSNDQNLIDSRQVLISAFQRAHPEITVKLWLVPFSTDAKRAALTELLRGGEDGPDVYLGDVIWLAEFAAKNLALPLDDQFDRAFWSRFDSTLLDASTYRGRVYAVPYFANRGLLYYRPDLMTRIGRPPPTTWEELAGAARLLRGLPRTPHHVVWQGDAYEGLTCVWTEFAASAGGRITDAALRHSTINTPSCARALGFMCGLVTQGLAPRDLATMREQQTTDLYNNDEVAFMRGWNTADTALGSKPWKYAATPLPTFAGLPKPGYSAIGGWSMFVNPRTRRLDAVRSFVEWMTSPPAQRTLSRYGQMPTNRSVIEQSSLDNDSPVLAVIRGVRPVARPAAMPRYPELSRVVYTNIHRALSTELSPAQALARAHHDLNAILAS